ncbi:hypothetical protein CEXT_25051 [Caerostris extrusa]|uniref:Uncharacterized protein n=1 Tax=Caerostris extrusa TaxID=172846 RepID=A0AAV4TQ04_CAEEX|nr:hypothetical protein CEXT_25051 [Caerostris extrusa]
MDDSRARQGKSKESATSESNGVSNKQGELQPPPVSSEERQVGSLGQTHPIVWADRATASIILNGFLSFLFWREEKELHSNLNVWYFPAIPSPTKKAKQLSSFRESVDLLRWNKFRFLLNS